MFLQFFFEDRAEGQVDENKFVGASWKNAEDSLKPSEVIFVGFWFDDLNLQVSHDATLLVGNTWVWVDDWDALPSLGQLCLLPRKPFHLLGQLPATFDTFRSSRWDTFHSMRQCISMSGFHIITQSEGCLPSVVCLKMFCCELTSHF